MKHRRIIRSATLVVFLILAPAAADPSVETRTTVRTILLGNAYPLEFQISHHAALFHWVDSLSGVSGGKTIPAHQREYRERLGNPTATETKLLDRYARARVRDARRPTTAPDDAPNRLRGMSALRRTFLEARDLTSALERAELEMDPEDVKAVRQALVHFDPRYEAVWQDGRIPIRFVSRFADDPKRHDLEKLLARVARFFDVDLSKLPTPAVVLAPVPTGYGTHATAVGPYLLIEIRVPDRLAHQASVIVHENSHFLFHNMNANRRRRVERAAAASERTRAAWKTLQEALPTALGQGVADRAFRPRSWSKQQIWYHTRDVDAYAKALYPLVREALETGEPFDEAFFRKAVAVYPADGRPVPE